MTEFSSEKTKNSLENYIVYLKEHDPVTAILATLVLVVLVGTGAQILADKLKIPSTGPLLFVGLLFGQAGIGIIQPEFLGDILPVIVKISVAVVVFEGGLLLDLREIRHATRAVLGLVTVGLLITSVLAGTLAHFLFGWTWELSFLFGAIVSVTGPTVITPILQRVRVNRRVKLTLESESIIADPLGVIFASLGFYGDYFAARFERSDSDRLKNFARRIARRGFESRSSSGF